MAMAWLRAVPLLILAVLPSLVNDSAFSELLTLSHFRWWPPMVLPVLIMGVLAGLRRKEGVPIQDAQRRMEPHHWRRKSDAIAAVIVAFFATVSLLEYFSVMTVNWYIWEAVIPWVFLEFVQSLTFEQGRSWSYRVLTHRIALEFGRISYTLYLMHVPFKLYVEWIYNAVNGVDCQSLDIDTAICSLWSYASVPLFIAVSIIGSFILNRSFEEPLRNWLRPARK